MPVDVKPSQRVIHPSMWSRQCNLWVWFDFSFKRIILSRDVYAVLYRFNLYHSRVDLIVCYCFKVIQVSFCMS